MPQVVEEIEFERSDGDETLWPTNNKRIVDGDGHVNFMHPVPIDDEWAVKWRKAVGAGIANLLKYPAGPERILKCWPEHYRMFIHYKGPQDNPRSDKYLIGAKGVPRFRSSPEFIPHAAWLLSDPTMTRSNCECKYCSKKPQRNITESLGISTRSSPSPSHAKPRRNVLKPAPKEPQERKPRQQKVEISTTSSPYAAIRRVAKPSKIPNGPRQTVPKERSNDLRAASGANLKRLHRESEVIWVVLDPPIRSSNGSDDTSIIFWPAVIESISLVTKPVPKTSQTGNADVDMDGASALVAHSSSTPVAWSVKQWTAYKVKLLAIPMDYTVSDDQVLPYQAYGPSSGLLDALRAEVSSGRAKKAAGDKLSPFMKINSSTAEQHQYDYSSIRFAAAAVEFSTAIQIAVNLSDFWTVTDDWEFKYIIPSIIPSEQPVAQSLYSALSASMQNNHHESISAPPQHGTGPIRNMSTSKLDSLNKHMLGSSHLQTHITQSFTQTRYQGLWWGTERIWTDELVRLKIARQQIAPDGADHVYAPAGPSRAALETAQSLGNDVLTRELGAEGRGVFMKLESLFVIDLPQERGGSRGELRASGMLYELVDADWNGEGVEPVGDVKGKGKERAHDGFVFNGIGQSSSFNSMNLDPALQSVSAPTSPLKARLLPNPDPAVPISDTSADVLAKTLPAMVQTSKPVRSPNSQLSNPGIDLPLPSAPTGFKFRSILPQGHEAVVSLSLISGRYYPGLLEKPLMRPLIAKACTASADAEPDSSYNHLWALEGLAPGFHNSVDPIFWKSSRKEMLQVADDLAQGEIAAAQRKLEGGDEDIEMLS